MTNLIRLALLSSLALAACSSRSGSAGDDGGDDGSNTGSDTTLDKADCAAFAQSMATAASTCGSPLPSGAAAMVQSWCEKGMTNADLCGGSPSAGMDCFASSDASDWTCSAGQPYPSCGGDLDAGLGAYCLMSLGNPTCASVACEYDVDCSGGGKCNSVTGKCFQASAYCIGLPCAYDVDCPSNEKCNAAEGACVGS